MRTSHTVHSLISTALLCLLAAGCSEDPRVASSTSAEQPSNSEALVLAPQTPLDQPAPAITVEVGGIKTTFVAHYADARLRRITEVRVDALPPRNGEYLFQGARLLRYHGAALDGADLLTLEFNVEGTLVAGNRGSADASAHDIEAVRTRASVLRSLALAHHDSTTHMRPAE